MALSQNTLKKIKRLFFPPKDINAMLKSILVPTANGKPQTASSRLPFAVNAMLKVPIFSFAVHVEYSSRFSSTQQVVCGKNWPQNHFPVHKSNKDKLGFVVIDRL